MSASDRIARRIRIRGLVQGVGFRPFVHRLAAQLRITGWVRNDDRGVLIHAEGVMRNMRRFVDAIRLELPPAARIDALAQRRSPVTHVLTFTIRPTPGGKRRTGVRVPPDRRICEHCRAELFDPDDRRYRYPFITCTDCGPRYAMIYQLPYDRNRTGMQRFPLCPACQAEYDDPTSRRFHAESTACAACGPTLEWRDARNQPLSCGESAFAHAVERLRNGDIIALKGVGGFQLLTRADRASSVAELRRRKRRPYKPFAVMVRSYAEIQAIAVCSPLEHEWLESPANPIVLLRKQEGAFPDEVAPHLTHVGVLLPTSPLHELLLAAVDFPLICTSGNRSDEPIHRHERGLVGIADGFLTHDRPIVHRIDDSVIRIIDSQPTTIRLGRGFAPLSLPALERFAIGEPILAMGGHQKNALALWTGQHAILGPHIGDLDHPQTRSAWERFVKQFPRLHGCRPSTYIVDTHPDYFPTRWASEQSDSVESVYHHHAHVVACMVEHDLLEREVLAFTWDGTGYGPDGTIWGGEVLRVRATEFTRVAALRPMALIGGEHAIREPFRIARELMHQSGIESAGWLPTELIQHLHQVRQSGVNTPLTTSMGRLFDGIASWLLGVREVSSEGEAAAWLESRIDHGENGCYPLPNGDWRELCRAMVHDRQLGASVGVCAARFHHALTEWVAEVASQHPEYPVILSGGCFQNAYLTEAITARLRSMNRLVFTHRSIPPNDGGLAVGQLAVAMARRRQRVQGNTDVSRNTGPSRPH